MIKYIRKNILFIKKLNVYYIKNILSENKNNNDNFMKII